MKQVYMETFGCQMNVADTDRMEYLLFHSGYTRTSKKKEADLVLINTCSIREKAEQKIWSLMGGFKPIKQENPEMILGLTGCLAQQEGEKLIRRFPHLDLVLGPDTVESISWAIDEVRAKREPLVWTEFEQEKKYSIPVLEDAVSRSPGSSAFVNIIKGCDKFCSFCVVPFTRGREKSREADEIYQEVRQLTERGAREIILLGQNVNAYGKRDLLRPVAFHELLFGVEKLPGVERLRFTTSHPKDFTSETIQAFQDLKGLMNHLHLPVQSGNNRVLEAMRRGHTITDYLKIIEGLKQAVPDMAFSTDIIVGFPGETDKEFRQTLDLIKEVGFDNSYMFAYSPRPGTPAAELEDSVPEEVKKERLQETIELQKSVTEQNGKKFLGREVEVLIEGASSRPGNDFKGRNPQYWTVHVRQGNVGIQPGDKVSVRVEEHSGHVLAGNLVPKTCEKSVG